MNALTSKTAQRSIFVRYSYSKFTVKEELLHLLPLLGKTHEEDIYNYILKTFSEFALDIKKLALITSDGAPTMIAVNKGFVSLIKENKDVRKDVLSFHCITHQENLVATQSDLYSSVVKDAIAVVNFIRSHTTQHRQFREFLKEFNMHYDELIYHSAVRWLSKGAVLIHFFTS